MRDSAPSALRAAPPQPTARRLCRRWKEGFYETKRSPVRPGPAAGRRRRAAPQREPALRPRDPGTQRCQRLCSAQRRPPQSSDRGHRRRPGKQRSPAGGGQRCPRRSQVGRHRDSVHPGGRGAWRHLHPLLHRGPPQRPHLPARPALPGRGQRHPLRLGLHPGQGGRHHHDPARVPGRLRLQHRLHPGPHHRSGLRPLLGQLPGERPGRIPRKPVPGVLLPRPGPGDWCALKLVFRDPDHTGSYRLIGIIHSEWTI